MSPPRDFYDSLGVSRTASQEEIQRSYRKLARTYHPDVNKSPDAEERFKEVSEAYEVLSDPDQRRRYDTFGPHFRSVPEGVDRETWERSQRASATSGGRRAGPTEDVWTSFGSGGPGDIDLDDLFGGLFAGGGRPGRSWGSVLGADQEAELNLTVEEAYHGGIRSITLPGPDGPRTLQVTIPAGVTDGQRIRLKGQGGRGGGGAAAGDLYLVVRLVPDRRYRVEGRDIHVDLPVSPWEAALGTHVAVDTPGGEAKVRVPPGSSSGRRLRLRNRGMPKPGGRSGDLYAEVRIVVPRSLSEDEQRLFQELAATSKFDPRRHR